MASCQDQIDGNKEGFLKNQKSLLQSVYNITNVDEYGNIGKVHKIAECFPFETIDELKREYFPD